MAENNNGSRAIQTVLTVLLVLGGVWAVFRMQQSQMSANNDIIQHQIQSLQKQLETVEKRHTQDIANVMEWQKIHDEKYPPVWLVDKVKDLEDWREWWTKNVPGLDASQDGRIDALEREIMGGLSGEQLKFKGKE